MEATTVIIFVVALIVSLGFLLLVISLVPTINQLKSLLVDLEKTSQEVRVLAAQLKDIGEKVDTQAEKVGAIIESSKNTVEVVSNTVGMINHNFLKRSAGVLAILPAIRFGWNLVKKHRGGK